MKIEPPEEPDFFGLEEAKETKSNSTTSPADASEDPYQDLTLGKELLMAFKTVDKEEKKKKDPRSPLAPQAAVLERKAEQDRGRERTRAEGKTSHLKGVPKEEEAMREEGQDPLRARATGQLLQDASVVAEGSFTTTGFQRAVRA